VLQSSVEPVLDEQAAKRMFHPLVVARVIDETHDAKSIVFAVPDQLRAVFRYRAGQFFTLEIPWEGRKIRRCYSLASSPQCDPEPKVTVKRVKDGRASNWINDNVRAGDTMSVLPPEGRFVLTDTEAPLVLFAGGSGITPVISLAKTALVTGARQVQLFYANRDERSIIFKRELAEFAAKYPGRIDVRHHLDDQHGFVQEAKVRAVAERTGPRAVYYVCGPGPFMEIVERGVLGAGIDPSQLRSEKFVSLSDGDTSSDASAAPAAIAAPVADGGLPTSIEVELRGEKHVVPYKKGLSVLKAVREAGLDAPYSCEEGFCGCCAARLLEGKVHMDATDALTEEEKRRGLILTCQAKPLTSVCKVRYEE
jgi:3-ketosteroid 9alpha-monooxygenase subunit B